jgi:hypothetical protein
MANVTIRSSASDIGLGQKVVITGRVTRAAETRPRIVLRADSRDYSRAWANVGGRTDRAGRFRFSVQPEINTTFRVAVADGESRGGQSPPAEVRVYPLAAVSFAPTNGRTVTVMLDLDGPDIARFPNEDVRVLPGTARYGYYYLVPHGSNRAYRLGRARLRTAGCSNDCVRRSGLRVRVTRKLRRDGVLGCIHGTAYLGMGLPDPVCGRRVVRLR